jgi:hypothetical protein
MNKPIRITSDGSIRGTRVEIDGKPFPYAHRIEWTADANDADARLRIEVPGQLAEVAFEAVITDGSLPRACAEAD